jgi:gliding motility-associated-like protein
MIDLQSAMQNKIRVLLFTFSALIAWFTPVKATHLMGVDLTYTCTNNCTIRVHQRVYRDCAGAVAVGNQNFSWAGGPGCSPPTQIGGWQPCNNSGDIACWQVTEVTPVCAGTVTQCQNPGSVIRGVEEYYRWSDWNICNTNCNNYTIEWWGQNRNGGITSGAANQGLGSFVTTLNTALTTCNNSPQFNNPPVPYLCAGQPFTFNQGATDPDGDSLSYDLGPCYDDTQNQVIYNAGFSPTSPLGSTWTTTINPVTGDVSFIPNPTGNIEVGVMCVYVSEWRNGVLINQVVRDMQINVIACPSNNVPTVPTVQNVQNGQAGGSSTTGIWAGTCLGNNLCFNLPVLDANAGDSVTVWWSQNIPGATFFQAGNPSVQDTISGINPLVTFCWTPTAAGTYSFLVQMRDNACPSYGFSQFTVTIRVSDPHVQAGVPILSCDTVTLCGTAISGIPNFNYTWSGQGGLSANGSCFTHIYPGQGTYSYQLIMSDSIGCRDTVTGTITIPNTPIANAGPDQLFCTPAIGTLGVAPSANTSYFWDPNTSLSSGTVSNPSFNIVNPGLVPQTFQYILTATDNNSGCFDRDTVQITVSYPPQLTFAPTHVACYGTPTGSIDMTIANGLPSLDVTWSGPNAFSSASEDINNLYNGMYYVTVTDSAGCVSEDSVLISQPPSPLWANFLSDPICCNGSTDGAINTTVTGDSPPYNFLWSGPGGFSALTEDLAGLAAGTYYVEISDNINCVIRDSVVIVQPDPIQINFTIFDVSCNGEANGVIDADVTGGNGNYGYLWNPTGSTTDSIFNLPIGNYTLDVEDTCYTPNTSLIYWEDFEGHSPWTLNVSTGTNGADRNFWKISDAAAGLPSGTCAGPANGDTTLHITSLANPNGGAIYQTGGNCGVGPCPQTNLRAESPFINTVGFSNLVLSFDFMSIGDNLLDNASLLYNVGSGWLVLAPTLKSLSCAPGQGRWQNFTIALPAIAAGITDLQLAFNWTNNDDGAGAAPSIAINNIRINAPRTVTSSICTATAMATLNEPGPLGLVLSQTQNLCFGGATGSITSVPSGGNGNFSFLWSNGSTQQNPTGLAAGMYYVTMTDTAYTPAGGALGYLLCFYQDSILVTEPTPVSLSTSSTLVSCFLGSDGTATVVASGGTPGYTYQWSTTPVQTTPTATGLPTAAYFVTVTDANGCPDTAQVVVSQPSPIAVVMSQVNATCGQPNGIATANPSGGTPGYTYQWSTTPVQTTQTAVGLLPGFYGVTVTDANGCLSFGGITVGNEPNPTASIASQVNVLCFGNSTGSATAAGSGGTAPYNFLWSNGQTTPTATGLPAGVHAVQISDAFGCKDTAQVNITQPPLLTGTTIVQNMGCNATSPDGTIGVLPTGGVPGYTYAWSTVPLQTTQMATNVGPGIYFVTITDANGCEAVISDTVIQVPSPTVVAGPDVSFCDGSGGAQVSATGSGGTTPYFYTWSCNIAVPFCGLDSINDDDPIANPDTSNWYYVFITDVNGCISNIDSVFVTVLPQPVVNAGADLYICGDSAPCVVLNPTIIGPSPGPFIYDWSPGNTLNDSTIMNPCARPDTTTIYTLQVTDGNGCVSQLTTTDTLSSITVHVNPIPVADAGPDRDICYLDSAMLHGIGSGAGPVYEFQWSPGTGLSDSTITNPYAFPPITTTYTLVVWSNGCPSYADTVQVRVHTIPTVDAGWDREVCLGDSAILDAQASGDSTATYTYQWNPPIALSNGSNEDASAAPDSTTAYWVVATTSWGCESAPDTAVVYVKPTPISEAGPNLIICAGDSVTLQGSYSYTTTDSAPVSQVYFGWTPANVMNDSTLVQPTVWPTVSTWFTLEVRYNTCSTSDSVLVTVVPDVGATLMADTTVLCGGDSVQLSSTGGIGGASFTWSPPNGLSDPNSANPLASPDTTTTYTLVVAEGGCGDTLSVTLAVIPRPIAEYISSLTEGCIPHTVNFIQNSQNDIAYVWNFGDGTPVSNFPNTTHTYTEAGTYDVTLTVMNSGGCASTFSGQQVVALDTPSVAFTSDPAYPATLPLPNATVQFTDNSTNAVSWIWEFGDGIISSDLNPAHTYQAEGTYFVTLNVTNAFGCIGRIMGGPFVVTLPDLFIPNVFSPNGDGINDVFLVDYTGSQPFTLQVFDRWGVLMYQSSNRTAGWDGINTTGSPAPDGVYYYHVSIGQKDYTNHITLMR